MQRIIARLITPNKEIQQSTNRKVDYFRLRASVTYALTVAAKHRRGLASGLGTLHQPTHKKNFGRWY